MPGALQEIYFPSFINLCVSAGFYLLSTVTVRLCKNALCGLFREEKYGQPRSSLEVYSKHVNKALFLKKAVCNN